MFRVSRFSPNTRAGDSKDVHLASLGSDTKPGDIKGQIPPHFDDCFEGDGSRILDLMAAVLKPSGANRKALANWLDSLNALPFDAQGLGVNTHSALIFMHRMGVCQGEAADALNTALRRSWQRLTGKVPKDLNRRLPRRVLYKATRDERDLHAAAFQTQGGKSEAYRDAKLLRDYTPEPRDAAYALAALLLALTDIGADILIGGVVGLLIATIGESALHQAGGHPGKKMRVWTAAQSGHVRRRFRQAMVGHLYAHHTTYRKHYGVQFDSPEHQAKLDAKLDAIKAKDPAIDIELIKKEQYGLTVNKWKVPGFAQSYLVAATALLLLGAALGLEISAALVIALYGTAILPPFASKYLHPQLHKARSKALGEASPPMRWLLKTRMIELIDKLHFGHHRGHEGNFNLVTPFGDRLRHRLRLPTVKHLLAMRESEKWPRAEFPEGPG